MGLPLDRSLTFKPALEQKAKKFCARNNLIRKLVGTNWGANGNVLRTSVLSLVYSTAEYAAPVWYKSAHTNKVDVELNIAMRTITGAVDSTPLPWLHVNSNIAPPHLRRNLAAHNQWQKCFDNSRSSNKNLSIPHHHDLCHDRPFGVTLKSKVQAMMFMGNGKSSGTNRQIFQTNFLLKIHMKNWLAIISQNVNGRC